MADRSDDETLFDPRLEQLPADSTITPRTLARDPSSRDIVSELPLADLPRIALEGEGTPLGAPPADYALSGTLGEGGMGRVHLARQRSLERDVAIKSLRPGAPNAVARALLREARLTGSLEHPGVIPVHALGLDDDGRPILVMKRVDGVDLGTLLDAPEHPLWRASGRSSDPLVARLEIVMQVCLTLELAHSRGVIHRDIKPENVMVGAFGQVYLLDWGIASTDDDPPEAGVLLGTPVYMAPEMARGRAVDVRTDVYLLGATLHTILTGRPRHEAPTVLEVLRAAMASAPVEYGPDVPERLAELCNAATSVDPAARPQTVERFREEIADFLRYRSARALSDAAYERLSALEQLLDEAGTAPPADLPRAYRLATEARFGFAQSLDAHATDAVAREGMTRCVIASVDLELRQDHAESAEALLRELEMPPSALPRRIEAVRAKNRERMRAGERLATLERDLDPSQQARRRTRYLLVMVVLVIAAWSIATGRAAEPTPEKVVGLSVVSLVLAAIIIVVIRKRVLTNAFNQRIAAFLTMALVFAFTNRLLGLLTSTPVRTTLSNDLLVFAAVSAGGALTLSRGLWMTAAVLAAGSALTRLRPTGFVVGEFVLTVAIALGVGAWAFARGARRA